MGGTLGHDRGNLQVRRSLLHGWLTKWAQAIEGVLRDRSAAFARAGKLLAELADQLTWEAAVTAMLAVVPRTA